MPLREQFQHLVDTHYDSLWSYAHFLTRGAIDSEDLMHQTFLAAHQHLLAGKTFRVDAAKWLRGTLRNLARMWWRERRKVPHQLADHAIALPHKPGHATVASRSEEMRSALDHCLEKLPPADRQLLVHRYDRRTPVATLAEGMSCNVATLRWRLFRIRQALKTCVETVVSRGGAV